MTDTLTQIVSKVQASLLDDGTLFTTATITAAARLALSDFNLVAPVHAGTLVEAVADQKEYVLSDTDFDTLVSVLDVLEWDDDGDDHKPLDYDDYIEDNVPVIRLRTALDDGFLVVRFTQSNTVSGLDSATESTLLAWMDPILLVGICYWTLQIRGVGRIEVINLNKGVVVDYKEMKNVFDANFKVGLAKLKNAKSAVGEPDTRAWNDKWHNWD